MVAMVPKGSKFLKTTLPKTNIDPKNGSFH